MLEYENIFSPEPPHILEMCPNFVNSYLKKRKSILLDNFFLRKKSCVHLAPQLWVEN